MIVNVLGIGDKTRRDISCKYEKIKPKWNVAVIFKITGMNKNHFCLKVLGSPSKFLLFMIWKSTNSQIETQSQHEPTAAELMSEEEREITRYETEINESSEKNDSNDLT